MDNRLRRAMEAADVEELDAIAKEIGAEAVQTALAVQEPDHARERQEAEAREKAKADAAEQRQRDLDAALADVVEMVARHRARLGRKTCTTHDGGTIRRIFDALRNLHPGGEE